jgi:hypothetical protein
MKTLPNGYMVFDYSDKPLAQKIAAACETCKARLGYWPTIVWVHPETLGDYESPNGLKVTPAPILRDHFLAGRIEEGTK